MSSRALAALAVLALSGCEWFSDFKQQPKLDTWEVVRTDSIATRSASDSVASRGNPQMSVPVTGMTMPGFMVGYGAMPGVVDSMSGLRNPVAADARSLENGRKYYQINCAVCHGASGDGNGAVTKFGMPPIPLTSASAQGYSDGYIWGMIRNGRGLMPTYNRIDEADRWDVVNYVRALQGRGGAPADTTWTVVPGETGDSIPGVTRMGPTRPAPFMKPVVANMPPRDTTAAADPHAGHDMTPPPAPPPPAGGRP